MRQRFAKPANMQRDVEEETERTSHRQAEDATSPRNSGCLFAVKCSVPRCMNVLPLQLSSTCLSDTSAYKEVMETVSVSYFRPYNADLAGDVDLLQRLWHAHNAATQSLDSERPFASISEGWKHLGFQGTNPATDFRAAGVFGLMQLVFLAESLPQAWRTYVADDMFLTSAAGLNITGWLISTIDPAGNKNPAFKRWSNLVARSRLCTFMSSGDTVDVHQCLQVLNSVFAVAMQLLWRTWCSSQRNIMEFNSLLRQVYIDVEILLFAHDSYESFNSMFL